MWRFNVSPSIGWLTDAARRFHSKPLWRHDECNRDISKLAISLALEERPHFT